ncbi:MAG: cytochrome-c peroxidase [Leptolyngbyaceae cyanobacterium MO_188.B28]|nr:cytochrome-c peroxidase [Leptolyngbyaceae cyanobacterium MO_188.B28]
MALRVNIWQRSRLVLLFVLTIALLGLGFSPPAKAQAQGDLSLLGPALPTNFLGEDQSPNPTEINLGRELYYDKRLSKNQDISCNSCHQLNHYGVDNRPVSPGHKGQLGARNSPSVYNAAAHIAQFWDGRAADVEEQALGPILNPVEMAMPSQEAVLAVLNSIPEYVDAFKQAFPTESNPVTYANVGKAIGAFERGLVTPSPFDAYFAGDESALTSQQQRGLSLFVENGCVACHNGTYFGGNSYQKVGLVEPWPNQKDPGRYNVTEQAFDRMTFKVPSLRNVAETAPYFHDGSAKTLDEAVRRMAHYQLGKDLEPDQVEDIAAFLEALTGDLPADYIQPPTLPVSTAMTPEPDPT